MVPCEDKDCPACRLLAYTPYYAETTVPSEVVWQREDDADPELEWRIDMEGSDEPDIMDAVREISRGAEMPNGSMFERVARALADLELPHCGGADSNAYGTGKPAWTYFETTARVAIATLREPTEEMITALLHEKVRDTTDQHERDVAILDWQFLIDQALK